MTNDETSISPSSSSESAPSLPPPAGQLLSWRTRTWELTVVLLATLGVLGGGLIAGHYTLRSAQVTVDEQRDNNQKTLRAQIKSLKKQARQEQAGYLRTERKKAYAALLGVDHDLRALEYTWRDSLKVGAPSSVLEREQSQTRNEYSDLNTARLEVQLVATCAPRQAAIGLGDAHLSLIQAFATGRSLDAAVSDMEEASGYFLLVARKDIKRPGQRSNARCEEVTR